MILGLVKLAINIYNHIYSNEMSHRVKGVGTIQRTQQLKSFPLQAQLVLDGDLYGHFSHHICIENGFTVTKTIICRQRPSCSLMKQWHGGLSFKT